MRPHQTESLDNIQRSSSRTIGSITMGNKNKSKKKTGPKPAITQKPQHKPVLAILPKRAKISRKR